MQNSYRIFTQNMTRVKALGDLHTSMCKLVTVAVDLSDLLRAQIVLSVSALDAFIHGIVLKGVQDICEGARPRTEKFDNLRMRMRAVQRFEQGVPLKFCLADEVLYSHGFLSFQ